jgi:hypothetical protein
MSKVIELGQIQTFDLSGARESNLGATSADCSGEQRPVL